MRTITPRRMMAVVSIASAVLAADSAVAQTPPGGQPAAWLQLQIVQSILDVQWSRQNSGQASRLFDIRRQAQHAVALRGRRGAGGEDVSGRDRDVRAHR